MTCHLCQGCPGRRVLFKSFLLSKGEKQGFFESWLFFSSPLTIDIYSPYVPKKKQIETSPLETQLGRFYAHRQRRMSAFLWDLPEWHDHFTIPINVSDQPYIVAWVIVTGSHTRTLHCIHTLDVPHEFLIPALLQMMPPLPMPPFMRYRMYSFVFWRQHTIDHHMMAIVCGEYLAHVDCMEVRFNNEGVFVHALSQSPLISNWFPNSSHSPLTANLVIIIAFIDIPIATHHDTIKEHATFFTGVLSHSLHIQSYTSGPNTFENSFISRQDSSQMYLTLLCSVSFMQKTEMSKPEKQRCIRCQT